jgi:hypothetical protein
MRIQKKKTKKTRLMALLAVALVALLVAGAAYWWSSLRTGDNTTPTDGINYNPPTEAEKQETTERKKEIIENEQPPSTPPESTSLTVTISRAGQNAAGQAVNVRTIIDGTSAGTCTMTLTKQGAQTVTKNASITYDGTLTTCNVDVPATSFETGGEWSLSVVAKTSTATSKPATANVTVAK